MDINNKPDQYVFHPPRWRWRGRNVPLRYGKVSSRLYPRDWLEIVLTAVIIAFIFKALVFEPSVVPTNSMAPTIYGKTWQDCAGNRFSRDNNDEYRRAVDSSREILSTAGVDVEILQSSRLVKRRIGDRVIVNKFIYGAWFPGTLIPTLNADWFRLPALRKPRRGDIAVFTPLSPENTHQYWVKRVIGLPGETIEVRDCTVYINGVPLDEEGWFSDDDDNYHHNRGCRQPNFGPLSIPEGNYFMMGDNRNESRDSRYIGVIPERNLRGVVVFRFLPLNRISTVR